MSVKITCEEDISKVAPMWPNNGNKGEKEKSRRGEEGVENDQGGVVRHRNKIRPNAHVMGKFTLHSSCIYQRDALKKSFLQRSEGFREGN